jgi:hypothetical protein
MKNNGWQGDPVDVVEMPDGKLTSLDNTRIVAARQTDTEVLVNVQESSEPLNAQEINRFTKRINGIKQKPTNLGDAANIRILSQTGNFAKGNPFGSSTLPDITGAS